MKEKGSSFLICRERKGGQPPDENDGGNRLRGLYLRRAGADDRDGRAERREGRGQDYDL